MDLDPRRAARPSLWMWVILSLVLSVALARVGAPLVTQAAPLGIISFEFASTPEAAALMVASWGEEARQAASFSLGLDFLYLLAYANAIAGACAWAAASFRRPWLAQLGPRLAPALYAAAALDATENIALWYLLRGEEAAVWPALAAGCAAAKFALVLAGLSYAAAGGTLWVLRRWFGPPPLLPFICPLCLGDAPSDGPCSFCRSRLGAQSEREPLAAFLQRRSLAELESQLREARSHEEQTPRHRLARAREHRRALERLVSHLRHTAQDRSAER